jgi:pyruvate dehydrogenase (quinone)
MLGTDFPYNQFLPGVTTVQVDRAGEVLGRRTGVDLPIHGDVLETVRALIPLVKPKKDAFLKAQLKRHEKLMTKSVGAYTRKVEKMKPIHPEYAASILDDLAARDAILTADTGMCNVWTARYLRPMGTRRLIGSFLHGSMANALPQAIGAQAAFPQRQVISVSGDGGLSMMLGELVTVAMYQLPVKIVVFNNSSLGMVKLEMLVDGLPDYAVDVPATNYAAVAEGLGIKAVRITDPRKLASGYKEAFDHRGPALVDIVTDPKALSLPPEVTSQQVFGFATAMSKIVLNRGAGEAVAMAKSNIRNIPR